MTLTVTPNPPPIKEVGCESSQTSSTTTSILQTKLPSTTTNTPTTSSSLLFKGRRVHVRPKTTNVDKAGTVVAGSEVLAPEGRVGEPMERSKLFMPEKNVAFTTSSKRQSTRFKDVNSRRRRRSTDSSSSAGSFGHRETSPSHENLRRLVSFKRPKVQSRRRSTSSGTLIHARSSPSFTSIEGNMYAKPSFFQLDKRELGELAQIDEDNSVLESSGNHNKGKTKAQFSGETNHNTIELQQFQAVQCTSQEGDGYSRCDNGGGMGCQRASVDSATCA